MAWVGVIAVVFLLALWLRIPSPPQEVLWNAGGIWAFTRVTQFLLMTRGAQAVLIWVGGRGAYEVGGEPK